MRYLLLAIALALASAVPATACDAITSAALLSLYQRSASCQPAPAAAQFRQFDVQQQYTPAPAVFQIIVPQQAQFAQTQFAQQQFVQPQFAPVDPGAYAAPAAAFSGYSNYSSYSAAQFAPQRSFAAFAPTVGYAPTAYVPQRAFFPHRAFVPQFAPVAFRGTVGCGTAFPASTAFFPQRSLQRTPFFFPHHR